MWAGGGLFLKEGLAALGQGLVSQYQNPLDSISPQARGQPSFVLEEMSEPDLLDPFFFFFF